MPGRRARSSETRRARWWELAVIYLLAVVVYAVLAREVQAPYKFVDEALYGGMARSIAFGGGAAWRGVATGIHSLYPYAIAPAWLLFGAAHAYALAKTLNAVMACAVVVPVWLLARTVTDRAGAALTAVLAVAGTWMLTSGHLITESLGMPLAAAALVAMCFALADPGGRARWAAFVFAALAAMCRIQLVVLLPVFALACLLHAAAGPAEERAERLRGHRAELAISLSASAIGLAAAIADPRLLGRYAGVGGSIPAPLEIVRWMIANGVELALVCGVIPLVAAVALGLRKANWRDPRISPLLAVTAASVCGFLFEAGWFSVAGGHGVIDRYIVYPVPLMLVLFVAAARNVAPRPALIVTAGVVLAAIAVPISEGHFGGARATSAVVLLFRAVTRGQSVSTTLLVPLVALALGLLTTVFAARSAGDSRLGRPRAAEAWPTAMIGLLLLLLIAASAVSWNAERARSAHARGLAPATAGWLRQHYRGRVSLIYSRHTGPPLALVTELFNPQIDSAYAVPGSAVRASTYGPSCALAPDAVGVLRTAGRCREPARALVIPGGATSITLRNATSVYSPPHFPDELVVATGPPELLASTSGCRSFGRTGRLIVRLWLVRTSVVRVAVGVPAGSLTMTARDAAEHHRSARVLAIAGRPRLLNAQIRLNAGVKVLTVAFRPRPGTRRKPALRLLALADKHGSRRLCR